MSDRNWEKEYNEMLAACLESGQAYEKIIAEKNSELARLRDYYKASQELLAIREEQIGELLEQRKAVLELVKEWNGLANSDLSLGYGLEAPARKEVWKNCADDLAAVLNESEPK